MCNRSTHKKKVIHFPCKCCVCFIYVIWCDQFRSNLRQATAFGRFIVEANKIMPIVILCISFVSRLYIFFSFRFRSHRTQTFRTKIRELGWTSNSISIDGMKFWALYSMMKKMRNDKQKMRCVCSENEKNKTNELNTNARFNEWNWMIWEACERWWPIIKNKSEFVSEKLIHLSIRF